MDVPPVHPEARRHEGTLFMLDVLGLGRQSEKLCLPGRNGSWLVRPRERNSCLGDLYLKRRR